MNENVYYSPSKKLSKFLGLSENDLNGVCAGLAKITVYYLLQYCIRHYGKALGPPKQEDPGEPKKWV